MSNEFAVLLALFFKIIDAADRFAPALADLQDLLLEAGDALSNANSIILMGKVRSGTNVGRALHVAKHRGSACDDGIHPYTIGDAGLNLGRG